MLRCAPILFVLCALTSLALCACGDASSYELRWTIGCKGGGDCEPRSIKGCSSVGLDSVQVEATVGADLAVLVHPCYAPGEGAVGRGPDLEPGAGTLRITGLSPAGIALTKPVTTPVVIPDEGLAPVTVDLPVPAQCNDGVDNDKDGLVDLLDPDCKDSKDADERD